MLLCLPLPVSRRKVFPERLPKPSCPILSTFRNNFCFVANTILNQVEPTMLNPQHISTYHTGLVYWGYTTFTLMLETGHLVIWGKTAEADSPALHIYNGSSDSWRKDRRQTGFCEYSDIHLLPLIVQKKQLLAVSCWECKNINLHNMQTRETTTAFQDPRYFPGPMTQGDEGQIYVVHMVRGPRLILQLNCAQQQFTLQKTIQSGMERCFDVGYIPSHQLVIVSSIVLGVVRAVSCDTGEKVWEVRGEIQGEKCESHGIVYSPGHQAFLVADGKNTRILVLNPVDKTVRQVVKLSEVGIVWELCLHNQQLVVHHGNEIIGDKISFFSIH